MDSPAGGDIDDGAAAGFCQQGNGCPANAKRGLDIDGERGSEVVIGRVGYRTPSDDPCIVDDNVEAAELFVGFARQRVAKSRVHQVSNN